MEKYFFYSLMDRDQSKDVFLFEVSLFFHSVLHIKLTTCCELAATTQLSFLCFVFILLSVICLALADTHAARQVKGNARNVDVKFQVQNVPKI